MFWKKLFLFLVCLALVLIGVFGTTAYALITSIQAPTTNHKQVTRNPKSTMPSEQLNSRTNILLLGIDDGEADNSASPRRSDTMIVANLDPDTHTVHLLSIPRDTKVTIPGRSSYDKVAHAFSYGGSDLAVRTVESNFHIPINYYVLIDWQAFIKVVDILGGVNINIEQNMNYDDPYANLHIHLNKGYQHLNGEQAGEYVRFRHDELGDIGRVDRQQKLIKELIDQILQPETILKLPSLISTLRYYVQTNIDTYTLLKVANLLKTINPTSLVSQTVPGDFATIDGLSYWVPNTDQLQQMIIGKFLSNPRY